MSRPPARPALLLALLVAAASPAPAAAADALTWDASVDVPITLAGGVFFGVLYFGQGRQTVSVATPAEPPSGLDGWARLELDQDLSDVSDVVLGLALTGGLAANVLDGRADGNALVRALLFTQSFVLIGTLTETVKYAVRRPRPYTYDDRLGSPDDDTSFFSGHTSVTAMAGFHTARALDLTGDLTPGERWLAYGSAGLLTATVATLRVLSGKHYPSDVLVGAVVGGVAGWLVAEAHRVERVAVSAAPLPGGGVAVWASARW